MELFTQKYKSYHGLATCCIKLSQYQNALQFMKKALEIAYVHEDIENELKYYDAIGKAYYYLGFLKKASYYHDRAARGVYEQFTSDSREKAKTNFKEFENFNRLAMGNDGDIWVRLPNIMETRHDIGNDFSSSPNFKIDPEFLRSRLADVFRGEEFRNTIPSPRGKNICQPSVTYRDLVEAIANKRHGERNQSEQRQFVAKLRIKMMNQAKNSDAIGPLPLRSRVTAFSNAMWMITLRLASGHKQQYNRKRNN